MKRKLNVYTKQKAIYIAEYCWSYVVCHLCALYICLKLKRVFIHLFRRRAAYPHAHISRLLISYASICDYYMSTERRIRQSEMPAFMDFPPNSNRSIRTVGSVDIFRGTFQTYRPRSFPGKVIQIVISKCQILSSFLLFYEF